MHYYCHDNALLTEVCWFYCKWTLWNGNFCYLFLQTRKMNHNNIKRGFLRYCNDFWKSFLLKSTKTFFEVANLYSQKEFYTKVMWLIVLTYRTLIAYHDWMSVCLYLNFLVCKLSPLTSASVKLQLQLLQQQLLLLLRQLLTYNVQRYSLFFELITPHRTALENIRFK